MCYILFAWILVFYVDNVFTYFANLLSGFCFPAHQSNNHCRRGKSFFFFLGLFIFTSCLPIVTRYVEFGGMVISEYLLRGELFFFPGQG